MNLLKNILLFTVILVFAFSCKKEEDQVNLDYITAPTNVDAIFDITQDNTGLVTIAPNAEGPAQWQITFGDVADEMPTTYSLTDEISHIYSEGTYTVGVTAVGITGLKTTTGKELNVTFRAPENLVVTITKDATNPKMVTVSAYADYATIMDIYFGDVVDEEPVHALPDEDVSHTYEEAGDYTITVVAKSGGAATIEYSELITIEAASDPVTLPIDFESFTVNYAFTDFGNAVSTVIDNPDASGINTSARVGQTVKAEGAETWAGSFLTLESPIDFSVNKLFKVKVWSPKAGATVKLKVENLNDGDISAEADAVTTVANEWEELTFNFSTIDMSNDYQKVVLFFDFDNPGDGSAYFFDDIKQASSSPDTGIVGTWKVASEAGSLGVGPTQGDISWWSIDDAGVAERTCYFDDEYIFGADGSFNNVLQSETWIEAWQGGSDACGTPVAPHDGNTPTTYTYEESAGTVTLNGTGSYLGLAKVTNNGELTDPADAPESVTYIIELSENSTVMTVDIDYGDGWWRYKLVKEGGSVSDPFTGNWQVAPEAGSLGVGPAQGDMSYWSIDEAGVTERACFYDDMYEFGSDGSFTNVLQTETWIEDWQGGTNACGAPVAPHDGNTPATYTWDEGAGSVTINGTGSYLGIPKATNTGELENPADAPASLTYIVEFSQNNTVMTVDIEAGAGLWWRYKLVKN